MELILPKWKPGRNVENVMPLIGRDNYTKQVYKALRTSSSSYIKRQDVRAYVFARDNYRCCVCQSTESLQVDHIISVYEFSKRKGDVHQLNSEFNLQTLCSVCNSSKKP